MKTQKGGLNKTTDIGIVLKTVRYGDHSVVAHLFCRDAGHCSFFVRSFFTKKSNYRSLFQPLYVLEVESVEANNGLRTVQAAALARPMAELASDPIKISIAFYCAELLSKTLPELYVNAEWFQFLLDALELLEHEVTSANYALWFTARMCKWYGVLPAEAELESYLKLQYPHWSQDRIGRCVPSLVSGDYAALREVPMAREERSAVLRTLLQLMHQHTGNTLKLQSLDVLAELFQ